MINFLLTVAAILFLVYKYFTVNHNYWKDRGVKFEEPNIIFGSYAKIFFGNDSPSKLAKRLYARYPDEKLVGCFQMRRPEIMIKDIDLVRHVLVKDFNHFMNRSALLSEESEPMNKNLFSIKSVKWRIMRKKLTPVFTSGKLRTMFPLVAEKGVEFQNYLDKAMANNDKLNMRELLSQWTTDVIGSVAFGIETGSMSDTDSAFRHMGKRIIETNRWKTFRVFVRTFSPSLFTFLRMKVHPTEIQEFFVATVRDIIKHRESTHYQRNDFLNLLIELKKQNELVLDEEEKMEFDDLAMTAQAFVFFVAGFETSSVVMACALNELVIHPEIKDKVVTEIDTVLKKHDGKISYDAISEMHYLEMIIYETMRKYPALSTLQRVCTKKYTFPNSDITIDKDIPVIIPALEIHYDPQYYPDPHKFIPERFSQEERSRRDPMTFLGFGEGPRICIGLRFGKMQSMVGLVSVLSKYKVEMCEKTEKNIKMNAKSFLTSPIHGTWVKLSPR